MSQTKAQLVSGTTAQNLTVDNINTTSVNNNQASGRKNIIINGGHNIAQRGTAAVTVTGSAAFRCVDRWKTDIDGSGGGDFSHSQATDVPDGVGLTNSSKITVVTQASQPSSEGNRNQLYYQLEKQDVAKLCWGTSSAKACTLSFYVKGSITGTYPMFFQYYGAGGSLYYFTNYTINSANTWERKTINVTGPTTGGTVTGTMTSVGLRIEWGLGYGSNSETGTLNEWTSSGTVRTASGTVYLPENSGATWFLTGCQFEIGSTATDFEHRSFGEEFALCKRYFQQYPESASDGFAAIGPVATVSTTQAHFAPTFPTMRAAPTVSLSGNSRLVFSSAISVTSLTTFHTSASSLFLGVNVASGLTSGNAGTFGVDNDTTAKLTFDAEF